jgi:hypothetical protein
MYFKILHIFIYISKNQKKIQKFIKKVLVKNFFKYISYRNNI